MKCVICGNESQELIYPDSNLGLPVFKCECGLITSGNDFESMKKKAYDVYEENYWISQNKKCTQERKLVLGTRWKSQFDYCMPYILKSNSVFEIGVGNGVSLGLFLDNGYTVNGIEPDGKNVSLINRMYGDVCVKGYAEDYPFTQKYDIIWMSHVLEHTIRPDVLLGRIKQSLNPKGILFIDVPNCDNKKIFYSSINENPSTYHFTKDTLLKLTKDFEVLKCDTFSPQRTTKEKIFRAFQKFTPLTLKSSPFDFAMDENGTDLRMVCK